jgi:hypothetical protein
VQQRNNINQNFQEKLDELLIERDKSIDWIMSLKEPNWENSYVHEDLGTLSAYQSLSN